MLLLLYDKIVSEAKPYRNLGEPEGYRHIAFLGHTDLAMTFTGEKVLANGECC